MNTSINGQPTERPPKKVDVLISKTLELLRNEDATVRDVQIFLAFFPMEAEKRMKEIAAYSKF